MVSERCFLLINGSKLAQRFEQPHTGWTRRYRASVFGKPDAARLAALAKGITLDGVRCGPIDARVERIQGTNAWLGIALREGKNREIRKVLSHFGLRVNRLIRVSFGPFQLGVIREQTGSKRSGKAH